MEIREITPLEAAELLKAKKAKFIDIRECSEFEEIRIPGACLIPMKCISEKDFKGLGNEVGIFYCRSGRRTRLLSDKISQVPLKEKYLLKGGIIAWEKEGLPVLKKVSKVPNIMRQTFILLGLLILTFLFLGLKVSPTFIWGAVFIGAGLVFAGLSGT